MLPSSNFGQKKNIANQQNYGKITQNFFSSLRYSPFPPKVDFDDVNIPSLWTKLCCDYSNETFFRFESVKSLWNQSNENFWAVLFCCIVCLV